MLRKSTFREIKTSVARYLAILSIVALGVGFFSGLKDCRESMLVTVRKYLGEHNLYDYQIATSYGIDDDSLRIAEGKEGVRDAEGSIQIDVMAGSGDADAAPMKVITLPSKINTLRVVEGRLPERNDECAVDNYSITDEGIQIGQVITVSDDNDKDSLKMLKSRKFRVVGRVNTPIYLDYQRGSTDIGNGSLDSFFYVQKDAVDADYYTALYLTLDVEGEDFSEEMENGIKARRDNMEDLAAEINDERRESARKEAQDKLDGKRKEYEDNLAEYESERYDAEKKISDARKELADAEKELDKRESEINEGITKLRAGISEAKKGIEKIEKGIAETDKAVKDLNGQKEQAEAGLKETEKKKEELDQAFAAGMIDEESYKISSAEIDEAVKQINEGIPMIDAGLEKAAATKKELKEKKAEADDALKDLNDKLSEANEGLGSIRDARNEIASGREEINTQEAEAYAEFAKAEKELGEAKEKIEDAQKEIDEMETGNSFAISCLDNTGYSSFSSNSTIVDNIAKIFPVFFFLIAALVCMTTMTRMIDEQRGQIGVLKALGYGNARIAGKYLFYSGSAAFMGAILGFFAGCRIFPAVIWNAYTMMYDFSDDIDYVIDPVLGIVSLAVALICSMGATWVSIRQDFTVPPSLLIRPKSPPAGKRIMLERIRPLWSRIGFLYKVSLRNIFRDKKRFLMMVIGVSGCTALLIAGFGIRTTIARIADYQFDEISLYDFVTVFSKDMDEEKQKDFISYMKSAGVSDDDMIFIHQAELTAETEGGREDLTCIAAEPDNFGKFINLHRHGEPIEFPGEGEAVAVSKLNHDFGVDIGDKITLRDGFRETLVEVSSVCDNYVYDTVYISRDTYEKGFGIKPEIKTAMIRLPDGTDERKIREAAAHAAGYEHAAAISVNMDVKDSVAKMMKSLDAVIYVVLMSAALLAFIVLYNLTNINITERIREIATIKVLGFYHSETSLYVFRENIFLTAIASLVGIPIGKWLLKYVIDNIVVKMVFFEPRLTNTDIIISVILTFVFAFAVNLVMQRRLISISMTESLKSVE